MRNRLSRFFYPKYRSDALEKKVNGYFGENTLQDVVTDILITSVSIDDAKPRIHKSDYFDRNSGRISEKLRDIAIATSSAPTYFPAKEKLEYSHNLIDGGVCANNPSMLALTDALLFERNSKRGTQSPNKDFQNIVMLSIGTGERGEMPYDTKKITNGGKIHWALPIIEILMESQSHIAHFQASSLLGDRYFRVNPKLSFKMQLDDSSKIDRLKNMADLDRKLEEFLRTYFIEEQNNV